MTEALDGTWSNHSCLLAQRLAEQFPEELHVEPEESLLGIPLSASGLQALLEGSDLDVISSYVIHLWQHVWWEEARTDFSTVHAGDLTLEYLRSGDASLCHLVRPFLPDLDVKALGPAAL